MTDAKADTILFQITDWWMQDSNFPFVLHVHGDAAARKSLEPIYAAFIDLAKENLVAPFFTAEDLNRRVAEIAAPLGLSGYYGPKTCGPDPVDQVRDASLFRCAAT